jgi:hypothetical protein
MLELLHCHLCDALSEYAEKLFLMRAGIAVFLVVGSVACLANFVTALHFFFSDCNLTPGHCTAATQRTDELSRHRMTDGKVCLAAQGCDLRE